MTSTEMSMKDRANLKKHYNRFMAKYIKMLKPKYQRQALMGVVRYI